MTTHKMYADGIRPPRGLGFIDSKDLLAICPHDLDEHKSKNHDKHNKNTSQPKSDAHKPRDSENMTRILSSLSDWLEMVESANLLAHFFEYRLNNTLRGTGNFRFKSDPKFAYLNKKKH